MKKIALSTPQYLALTEALDAVAQRSEGDSLRVVMFTKHIKKTLVVIETPQTAAWLISVLAGAKATSRFPKATQVLINKINAA